MTRTIVFVPAPEPKSIDSVSARRASVIAQKIMALGMRPELLFCALPLAPSLTSKEICAAFARAGIETEIRVSSLHHPLPALTALLKNPSTIVVVAYADAIQRTVYNLIGETLPDDYSDIVVVDSEETSWESVSRSARTVLRRLSDCAVGPVI